MRNLFFLLLCLFCISTEPTLYAQKDIFLQEFTDSTMFNFVGTAQLFNKRIRLTEAKNFQGGGIWLKDKKNVANDFAIEIGFQITNSDFSGADGIAFVIQNTSAFSIGQYGGGIGYSSIPNSLAIEFDTYYNPERNDPNDNHISIQSNGKNPISENHIYTLGMASSIPTMEDGNPHILRIEYVQKIFSVFLDDMSIPKIKAYVNVDSLLQLDHGTAWLGFTSSTGGSYANHDIVSFGHSNGLIANAGQDTTICFGKKVQIGQNAFGRAPFSYKWLPSNGLSNDTIARPWAFPKTTTTYYVEVKDTLGNIDNDSVMIIVDTCNAVIQFPDRTAKLLDTVSFPALVIPAINLTTFDPSLYSYTAYLHFPSTILYPLSASNASISHSFSDNRFSIIAKGLYSPKCIDTLFTLYTLAVLGNDTNTVLIIDSIHWEDRQGNILPLDISYIPGSCTITDICREGGARLLFQNNNSFTIQQLSSADRLIFDIKSLDDGPHSFQLYNIQGELIEQYSWKHIPSASESIVLHKLSYPLGFYTAMIKSPFSIYSYPFVIDHY